MENSWKMIARLLLYLYELRKNLRLEPSSLQEMQRKKLRAIIKHAYENVPFYHKKFDSAGIRPDDVKSVADLSKFPVTTKSEIQASSLEDIVARNIGVNRCIKRFTSGSTGIPLTIIVDKRAVDFEGAVWFRALFENGLRLRDRMAIIIDPRSFPKKRSHVQRLGITRRNYISIFDDAERQLALLEKYKPDVVKGYPSSLAILADVCNQNEDAVKPRLVFTSAELLDSGSRKLISSVFEAELLDSYASYETSLLAWECHEHMGHHINVDSVVVEFVNNGWTVAPGERGEIVCTSLVNYAMPLIRYSLGDVGVPVEEQCSCGRTLPLMKVVEGRVDDFLTALDGRIIPPVVFFPYPFENLEGIRQFRVIQERRDKLTIQLAATERFLNDNQVLEKARREVQKLFGEGMQVEFQILEKINRDHTGKLRKIISHIPVHFGYAMECTH